MAKRATKRLSSRTVDTAKPGKHADGGGLYLIVSPSGSRKWVFRYMRDGRAREMGLGTATGANLSQARTKALDAASKLSAGVDPLSDKARSSGVPTFAAFADEVRQSLSAGFRNEKHRAQWKMTLETYAAPVRRLARGRNRDGGRACLSSSRSGRQSRKPPRACGGALRRFWTPPRRAASDGGKPGALARASGPPVAEARQAHARASCRHALQGRSRVHRGVARAGGRCRFGAGIRHPDGGALWRGAGRALG